MKKQPIEYRVLKTVLSSLSTQLIFVVNMHTKVWVAHSPTL